MSAYVIQADNGEFVDYDDKGGPMSTGYPYLSHLASARIFGSREAAEKSAESAMDSPLVKKYTTKLTVKKLTVE